MKRSVSFFWHVGCFCFIFSTAFSQEQIVDLRLSASDGQAVDGWGFSPTPIDWDGNSMLRSQSNQQRLYSETQVDVVRILFGATDIYDEEKRTIKIPNALALIRSELAIFKCSTSPRYFISVLTPPPSMKHFVSAEGHVDLIENHLRANRQQDFANFIAQFLALITEDGIPLPIGISLQSRPEMLNYNYGCPPTTAQGCPYSVQEYWELCTKVRATLKNKHFDFVQLFGPEIGNVWSEDAEIPLEDFTNVLDAVDILLIHSPVSFSDADFLEKNILANKSARERGLNIWIVARPSVLADTENARIVGAFRQLGRDLVLLHANFWLWPYGFTWEESSESLRWGHQFSSEKLGEAVEFFWRMLPKGAKIRTLQSSDRSIKLNDLNGVDAFALVHDERAFLVIINNSLSEKLYSVSNIGDCEINIFQSEKKTQRFENFDLRKENELIKIPGESVAIVAGKLLEN